MLPPAAEQRERLGAYPFQHNAANRSEQSREQPCRHKLREAAETVQGNQPPAQFVYRRAEEGRVDGIQEKRVARKPLRHRVCPPALYYESRDFEPEQAVERNLERTDWRGRERRDQLREGNQRKVLAETQAVGEREEIHIFFRREQTRAVEEERAGRWRDEYGKTAQVRRAQRKEGRRKAHKHEAQERREHDENH